MWLNLAEVQVTLSAHIKVYPLLQEQNKPSAENWQKKMRRWEAEETGDVLNIKKEQNATKRWGNNKAREEEKSVGLSHRENYVSSKVAADSTSQFSSVYKWRAIDKHLWCQAWNQLADLVAWLSALRLRVCDLTSQMVYCTAWSI